MSIKFSGFTYPTFSSVEIKQKIMQQNPQQVFQICNLSTKKEALVKQLIWWNSEGNRLITYLEMFVLLQYAAVQQWS